MRVLRLAAAAGALLPLAALAQPIPADLATLPPVPTANAPQRTAWGDPDCARPTIST